ncbi:MAG: SDR family NAD(P)-dependent oxidoreductase [Chitinophagaceae bacterium]|nr:SDR family NAD(P)-dependent oxidoreductase [Chitinophagaceae bacterium]
MKKIIIIGATSGIGRELALCYIKAGHKVGITGRRNELLDELKHQYPLQTETECFDVTGNANIKHLENLIQKPGGMDVFVYNSGTADIHKEVDMQNEMTTTKTNVLGFVETTVYAFNYFSKQGHGQIAATSSVASQRGNGWAPSYSASKAYMSNYLEGLTIKAYRLKRNISITDIQPGFVNTKMAKGDGQFWVAEPGEAAHQIFKAIEKRKRRVFVTKRWALMAWLMRNVPFFIYRKMG